MSSVGGSFYQEDGKSASGMAGVNKQGSLPGVDEAEDGGQTPEVKA